MISIIIMIGVIIIISIIIIIIIIIISRVTQRTKDSCNGWYFNTDADSLFGLYKAHTVHINCIYHSFEANSQGAKNRKLFGKLCKRQDMIKFGNTF